MSIPSKTGEARKRSLIEMTTLIGWDSQDITPDKPVELIGQYYQRISKSVRDPLCVTALVMEQTSASGIEQAVMVSIDIIFINRDFLDEIREALRPLVPDLNPDTIFLNATHIHSGPGWTVPFRWWVPAEGAMQPSEIRALVLGAVVRAVVNAWKARQPGQIRAASAFAAMGFCRRMLYADGSAMMYGETDREDFIGVEAAHDFEVRLVFTWDDQDRLTGIVLNVACPAQVMEAQHEVSADVFGELRKRIHQTYGPQVNLLPQVSAAGCQSPRNLPIQSKDEINYWNDSGMRAIAGRLEKAVAEGYASALEHAEINPVLKHTVTELVLPIRRASIEEHESACSDVKRLTARYADIETASRELFTEFVADTQATEKRQPHGPFDNKELDFVKLENAQAVIRRFETQDSKPTYSMELHAIRLGDSAFVTNPFELFLDYGQMIVARSRANQTFLVQLACDAGQYLPTARAVAAGGYSALIINGSVGPEGGRMLVDASVQAIDQLWEQ